MVAVVSNGGIYISYQSCTCGQVLCNQCMTGCSPSSCSSNQIKNSCQCNLNGSICTQTNPCGLSLPPQSSRPSPPPSPQPSESKESSALYSSPFDSNTWQPAAADARIKFYWFIYSSYFLFLFLMFYVLENVGVLSRTRDTLHSSAFESNNFISFFGKNTISSVNKSSIIIKLHEKSRHRDELNEATLFANGVNRILENPDCAAESQKANFHHYILEKHTDFGCKPYIFTSALPKGLFEDFLIYMFNHHEFFKCFCSYDCFPLTYTAKRLMFIGRHTVMFLLSIIVNGIAVFALNTDHSYLYAINFFISMLLRHASDAIFQYIYYGIFIYLGKLLENKVAFNVRVYYLSCFVFLVVIVLILMLGCIFSTPTNGDNEPYQTRLGLLDSYILEIQLSTMIIEFILIVLLFVPNFYCCTGLSTSSQRKETIYPLLIVGQRFIENEYLNNKNDVYFCYMHAYCFYFEYAVTKSLATKMGWIRESKDNTIEMYEASNRISTVENSNNPISSVSSVKI